MLAGSVRCVLQIVLWPSWPSLALRLTSAEGCVSVDKTYQVRWMMCMSYWYNDILEYVLWYGGESRILQQGNENLYTCESGIDTSPENHRDKIKSSDVLHRPIEVTSSSTKAQMIQ